jgi:uncharacterized protein YbjT (DUF2867 family)
MTVLITGGTGTLGSALRHQLQSTGTDVRVLSRRDLPPGESPHRWATADLRTGVGLSATLEGADTVIHCATDGRTDVAATERLVRAAQAAGIQHLLYISIVGVDRHPLPYYRAKFRAELVVEGSGLPWTILRATQFHDLVYSLFAAQRRLPALLVPDVPFQTIAVADVAHRLAELAAGSSVGRAPDIGGPQVRDCRELAAEFLASTGRRRRIVPVRVPGRIFGAYAAGMHLTPGNRVDGATFSQFLETKPGSDRR